MRLAWIALFVAAIVPLAACKGCHPGSGGRYAKQPGPAPSAPAIGAHLKPSEVLAFVNPQQLPVYAGPTGSVEGTILIKGDPSPDVPGQDFHKCPAGQDVYQKLFRAGAQRPDGGAPLADALVAVTGYGAFFIPEREPVRRVTFDQCALDVRTVDMTVGQRIDVTGEGSQLFAPGLTQVPTPALMLATKDTEPVGLFPPRPGYYTLIDRMDLTFVRADVYVMLQPLHTVTGLDGHYRIDGIPVGTVTVNTRLARIRKEASRSVEVVADTVKTLDLSIDFKAATDTPASPTLPPGTTLIP